MPPKKREKESDVTKSPRMDHIQAEHELFLEAFEKPTQIYRYLRTRQMCKVSSFYNEQLNMYYLQPTYLNRTLSYMKHRMSRSHKLRVNFKIDDILQRVSHSKQLQMNLPRYMNISFLGLYDKTFDSPITSVQIDLILLKISYKKRKESPSQSLQIPLGSADVIINPQENELSKLVPSINISSDLLALSNGPLTKAYTLLLRTNLFSQHDVLENEPLPKRRKSIHNVSSRLIEGPKVYGSELVIYDKQNRCLLTDGDYEVYLHELKTTKFSPKKHSAWESAIDIGDNYSCSEVAKYPFIKLRLAWLQDPLSALTERPVPYVVGENKENLVISNNRKGQQEKLQLVYQFVYNNNSRQQTEACDDLYCPWCSLNCNALYTLLKHLKLCHPRFIFTYVPIIVGARIDVAINELYDGSYTGSPHDLILQPTVCAFSRNGPVRRASVTNILVCHPKRSQKPSLSEFLEQEDCDFDSQRPFITGHNRLYHHTTTCLPIFPKEMDVDSEGENDPEWLQTKTKMMIDEFTDVNEGEKELMKLWNLHVMKYGFVGDCQIPLVCSTFVNCNGESLLLKNLYRNFVVHLCSLFDFGLLSAVSLYQIIQKTQELVRETILIRTVLRESREVQMKNWNKSTMMNQVKEKLEVNKTPVRKTGSLGPQRRKGIPTPSEISLKRKSLVGEVNKKRLSVALSKTDLKPYAS